jgi:hypothetical protein
LSLIIGSAAMSGLLLSGCGGSSAPKQGSVVAVDYDAPVGTATQTCSKRISAETPLVAPHPGGGSKSSSNKAPAPPRVDIRKTTAPKAVVPAYVPSPAAKPTAPYPVGSPQRVASYPPYVPAPARTTSPGVPVPNKVVPLPRPSKTKNLSYFKRRKCQRVGGTLSYNTTWSAAEYELKIKSRGSQGWLDVPATTYYKCPVDSVYPACRNH